MEQLQKQQDEIAHAAPVWHELQYGCRRLPISRKRTLNESYLAKVVWPSLEILPYDQEAASWHAEQRARLATKGLSPSFVDGQNAAIATVNQLILVTRNTSDLVCFSKVEVQNWHEKP